MSEFDLVTTVERARERIGRRDHIHAPNPQMIVAEIERAYPRGSGLYSRAAIEAMAARQLKRWEAEPAPLREAPAPIRRGKRR